MTLDQANAKLDETLRKVAQDGVFSSKGIFSTEVGRTGEAAMRAISLSKEPLVEYQKVEDRVSGLKVRNPREAYFRDQLLRDLKEAAKTRDAMLNGNFAAALAQIMPRDDGDYE